MQVGNQARDLIGLERAYFAEELDAGWRLERGSGRESVHGVW